MTPTTETPDMAGTRKTPTADDDPHKPRKLIVGLEASYHTALHALCDRLSAALGTQWSLAQTLRTLISMGAALTVPEILEYIGRAPPHTQPTTRPAATKSSAAQTRARKPQPRADA
jgi:hypothetical protein